MIMFMSMVDDDIVKSEDSSSTSSRRPVAVPSDLTSPATGRLIVPIAADIDHRIPRQCGAKHGIWNRDKIKKIFLSPSLDGRL